MADKSFNILQERYNNGLISIEEDFEIDADDNTGEESFVKKYTVFWTFIYINSK